MENKYPEYILKRCRQCMDLEEDDTSMDNNFNSYSPMDIFRLYCQWEGLLGSWPDTLISVIEDCFKINLDKNDEC